MPTKITSLGSSSNSNNNSLLKRSNRIIKDPVRYPHIQTRIENKMKSGYKQSLQVMLLDIAKVIR